MDGHSYEAAMIIEWLRDNQTSPITNQLMHSKLLVRPAALVPSRASRPTALAALNPPMAIVPG